MPDRPILLLPHSTPLPRIPQRAMVLSHLKLPKREEQGAMLGPQLTSLLDAFIVDSPTGTSVENILVLETIERSDKFRSAVASVPGLKWLAEIDLDEIEPDNRFFERPKIGPRFFKDRVFGFDAKDSRDVVLALSENNVLDTNGFLLEEVTSEAIRAAIPDDYQDNAEKIIQAIDDEKKSPLPGRMYLSLSNRAALSQIKTMFDTWKRGGSLPYGSSAWGDIFSHLRTIRFWDVEDRVSDTGILDYWQKEVECKRGTASTVAFEIEFSYEENFVNRRLRQQQVEALVIEEGGTVIASCDIAQIHFQAIKIEVPVSSIERVLGGEYSSLYRNSGILFFRPSPQCAAEPFTDGTLEDIPHVHPPDGPPIVAVLDGLPFSRHRLLDGFLVIDDPDGFADGYQAKEFNHGTAMLSLICHGELDAQEGPITRKVYVRPILCPDEDSPLNKRPERLPKNMFFEDLVERSIRKMFIGDNGEAPSAPTVKIINLSIADPDQMFHRFPGPTARLLDWLSYKYKILFCVSAGNMTNPISLGMGKEEFASISDSEKITAVLSTLFADRRNRRILTPSESINSITVGALHDDESTPVIIDDCIDILPSSLLPSPLSPHGHGFRSAIKPEIVVPGGRQLFTHYGDGEFGIPRIALRSGQRVAGASVLPGERNRTIYTCGTSNATALATRGAAFIYDAISDVLGDRGIQEADDSIAAMLKALLVHGASWGEAADIIKNAILSGHHATEAKKEIARCLGYGRPDFQKSIECTSTRATAIGYGTISKDKRHEYRLPLPPSLSALDCWRKLTVTLAWLSPISVDNRKYRKAALTFEAKDMATAIGGKRAEVDWHQVRNGTLQHEILEGADVVSFQENDCLVIAVQCREDAGPLDVDVPYGLAVSLEVKAEVGIDLYQEVQSLIEVSVREAVRGE